MFKSKIYSVLCLSVCFLLPFTGKAQYDSITGPPPEEIIVQHFHSVDFSDTGGVTERHISADKVNNLKKDKAFWYIDVEPEKEAEKEQRKSNYVPIGERPWFQTILWIVIIAGFVAALVWYLISNQVNLFSRKRGVGENISDEEEMPEDIFAINYQKEIDKAAAQGNYRLAVRLLYLRLLKILADREIIRYKSDLTNFDYLMQLQPSKYYEHFFRLTRHYEYSWYGHFDVDDNKYRVIRTDFDQMDKEIQQS
jgi:hypothetical protein